MTTEEIIPSLLSACPSARDRWQEHLALWGEDERGAYNDVAVSAHHIVESYAAGNTEEFEAFFAIVEKLVESTDPEVTAFGTLNR